MSDQYKADGCTVFKPGASREHVCLTHKPDGAAYVARLCNLLLTMRDLPGVFTNESAWRATIDQVLKPMPAMPNNPASDQLSRDPNWAYKWIPSILKKP